MLSAWSASESAKGVMNELLVNRWLVLAECRELDKMLKRLILLAFVGNEAVRSGSWWIIGGNGF
jgi:hypothetical protein